MDRTSLRPYLAELIGTFALVLLSAGAVIVNQLAAIELYKEPGLAGVVVTDSTNPIAHPLMVAQPQLGLVGIALTTGFIYAAALAFTLPISAGYLNPAITLMLWVFKRLDGGRMLWLILAQVLGAALAGLLLRMFFSFQEAVLVSSYLGAPYLHLETFGAPGTDVPTVLKGIGVELGLTFLLVMTVFGTHLDPRALKQAGGWAHRLTALWLGLVVAGCTFVGFNLTGAALNPARWFGPAFWEMTVTPLLTQEPWKDHMVYWIGPIVGALLAGGLYTTLILPAEEKLLSPTDAAHAARPSAVTSTLYRAKK